MNLIFPALTGCPSASQTETEQRLEWARQAVLPVRHKLPIGEANKPPFSDARATEQIAKARAMQTTLCGECISLDGVQIIAYTAEIVGAGNCQEQSAVAFTFLFRRDVRPLEIMKADPGDHWWLVLGRPDGSDPFNVTTWGDDAVICDPWAGESGEVYVASQESMKQLMPNRWGPHINEPWNNGQMKSCLSVR